MFLELVKARLTSLVLLTTLVGFYMGRRREADLSLMLVTLGGTALVAFGAAALNQWMERDFDGLMERTQDRPLPSGRLQPATVFRFGAFSAVLGLALFVLGVNATTGLLGAVTLGIYLPGYLESRLEGTV